MQLEVVHHTHGKTRHCIRLVKLTLQYIYNYQQKNLEWSLCFYYIFLMPETKVTPLIQDILT